MNLLFLLFTGFTIGITGAIIPGPFTLFTVSEVIKHNKFSGLKTTLGHIIIEFVLITAIFLGFHKLFNIRQAAMVISVIGGLALIIMGILLLFKAGEAQIPTRKSNLRFNKGLVAGGIFFSVVSPGFIVWWATIGLSTILRAAAFGLIGVVVLVLGHWLADILWYGFISYAVDKGKVYLKVNSYQNIIRFFSILLVILGFWFLLFRV